MIVYGGIHHLVISVICKTNYRTADEGTEKPSLTVSALNKKC